MKNALLLMFLAAAPHSPRSIFGEWAPIRAEDPPNPASGDYVGLPISDAARMRADTWSARSGRLEWQCRPHQVGYITRGPSELRITKEWMLSRVGLTTFRMEWLRSVVNLFT
jgi:hypothetical protein